MGVVDVSPHRPGLLQPATGELEVRDATGATVSIEPFTGIATRVMVEAPGAAASPVATPAA